MARTKSTASPVIGIVLISGLLVSCATAEEPEIELPAADTQSEEDESLSELEALGDVEVDRGLFLVEIVLPADFSQGLTQESLDENLDESGFRSATLNDDGTVTYTMTKRRHDELLAELRESIQGSVDEFIADEPDNYSSVTFDENLRNFTVAVNADNFNGEAAWLEFSLAFQAGFYYIFAGTKEANQKFTVTYVDQDSGATLATSEWPKE